MAPQSKRRAAGPAVKRKPPRPKGRAATKRRLKRVGIVLLLVGLLFGLLGVGAFVVAYNAVDIPDPNEDFEAQTSKIYYADGKTELGEFATQDRESIPLDEMPQTLKDAVVAAENQSFWTDRGIDPKGILRAAFSNARGNSTQGASTITQQYVKILYLSQERSWQRKAREAILSLKLQRKLTKEQVLEGYLNTIYFGRGAYGVQAAAQAYFDKPAADLNLRESAVLASVLNDPNDLDPTNGKEAKAELKSRYDYVLSSMADMGTATAEEAEKAQKRLPKFPKIEATSQYGGQKGHMLKLIRDELLRLGYSEEDIDGGGLRVTTTFTPEAMAAAQEGQAAQRPEGMDGGQLHVAVATVEVGTGALLGFYGGQDYLDSQINWAVAGGMAGSTFKAFADAAAIKDGFSLRDTFDGNSPMVLPDGTDFENQGNTSYGTVSMIEATADSINTAFIDMTNSMEDGPQKIVDTANDLGIPGNEPGKYGIPTKSIDLQANLGVALGSVQVSPINMANSYATLANEGSRADVHVIEKVVTNAGETDYTYKRADKDVLDPDIAADVCYALQQVVETGSGSAALELDRPVAGKTGTATNDKGEVSSSWFVGTTPQISTAVMYVRGKGREQLEGFLPEFFGGSYPARTWTDVMGRVMEGMEVEEFPEPVYVDGDNEPEEGHEPYTPPPSPTRKPSPTKKPSDTPSTILPSDDPSTPTDGPTPSVPTPTPSVPEPSPSAPPPSPSAPPPPPSSSAPAPSQSAPAQPTASASGEPTGAPVQVSSAYYSREPAAPVTPRADW
ncbi:transglycosylase domain-containing protein [Nocardioides bigeumensis]|uniref:Penicillin-insensitive transglycosylase n=1 Tax=Nocardioides bigeumensis TaxID=433657 RepID=A0ABP5KQY7_9ACTN